MLTKHNIEPNGLMRSTPPRILIVSDIRIIHAQRPLRWAQELGYATLFLATSGKTANGSVIDSCIAYPRLRGKRFLQHRILGKFGVVLCDYIERMMLSRILRRWQPDIVHCHWIGDEACTFAELGVKNLILSAWGSDINQAFMLDATAASRIRIGKALAACTALTGDAEDIRRKGETLADKSLNWTMLPLGIATEQFRSPPQGSRCLWRNRIGIPTNTFVFGSFRAWTPNYRHDEILDAFAKAHESSPVPLGLVLKVYHPSGHPCHLEERLQLERKIKDLGVSHCVWWLEQAAAEELPAIYSAVDAIVNWPKLDALPVTFFEAAAAKRPVITCWHDAYEIPLLKECASIVWDGKVSSLATVMAALPVEIANAEWESRLISADRIVETEYSEVSAMNKLRQLYDNVMSHAS